MRCLSLTLLWVTTSGALIYRFLFFLTWVWAWTWTIFITCTSFTRVLAIIHFFNNIFLLLFLILALTLSLFGLLVYDLNLVSRLFHLRNLGELLNCHLSWLTGAEINILGFLRFLKLPETWAHILLLGHVRLYWTELLIVYCRFVSWKSLQSFLIIHIDLRFISSL